AVLRHLHSFPTRRSSDLDPSSHERPPLRWPFSIQKRNTSISVRIASIGARDGVCSALLGERATRFFSAFLASTGLIASLNISLRDRKSTRLNSSHVKISY